MNSRIDWIVTIGVILTLIQTLYIAIPIHAARRAAVVEEGKRPWRGHLWVMMVLMLGSWAMFGLDYYDRHRNDEEFPDKMVGAWGQAEDALYMIVDLSRLQKYASAFKTGILVHAVYSNIDKMTDQYIDKSELYTITNDVISMSVPRPAHLRAPDHPGLVQIESCVLLVPNHITMDQIKDMATLALLGGKVATCRGGGMMLDASSIIQGPPASGR